MTQLGYYVYGTHQNALQRTQLGYYVYGMHQNALQRLLVFSGTRHSNRPEVDTSSRHSKGLPETEV